MSTPSAIPAGSTVLVTAVNSYVGSHVADQLLLAGYKVRGSVRDEAKAKWAQELFDKKHGEGKFEAVVISNMGAEGAYDEVAKGVSAIAHVAANISMSSDPKFVIDESVNGALNALRAAAKQASVKRVVVTSSTGVLAKSESNEYTPEVWNDRAVKLAWEGTDLPEWDRGHVIYVAGKVESEKACWKYMQEEKPGFEFNTVLPSVVYGPLLGKGQNESSAAFIRQALDGQSDPLISMKLAPYWFIDVRDVALLHVAALTHPDVKSERIFGLAQDWNWTDIFKILRKAYPNRKVPDDIPDEATNSSTVEPKAYQRGVELLKRFGQDGFTSLEESIKANAESFTAV